MYGCDHEAGDGLTGQRPRGLHGPPGEADRGAHHRACEPDEALFQEGQGEDIGSFIILDLHNI